MYVYIYIYTLTMMYAFILLPSMLELIMLIYRKQIYQTFGHQDVALP